MNRLFGMSADTTDVAADRAVSDVDADVAEVLYSLLSNLLRNTPRDMSMTAASTLSTLRGGPRRITALATVQGVTQPSMTVIVGGLERDGLVERRRDPDDGRAMLVELTDAGREFVVARRRRYAQRVGEYMAKLPAQRRAEIAAAVPALQLLDDLIGE